MHLDLEEGQFSQDSFFGRLRTMVQKTSVMNCFITPRKYAESKEMLENFKNGVQVEATERELWKAKKIVDACYNSGTGKKILFPFRMCFFMPINVGIVYLVMSARTIPATFFWQTYNQTYNVILNYSYRGSSEALKRSELWRNYGCAVVSSTGTAIGLNEFIKSGYCNFTPRVKGIMLGWVPLIAVCAAQMVNLSLTRLDEVTKGTTVYDENGNKLGLSKKAGRVAVGLTVASRIFNACGIMGCSKGISAILKKNTKYFSDPKRFLFSDLLSISIALSVILPCALALFKQRRRLDVKKAETEFWNIQRDGKRIRYLYFQKGL